MEGNITDSLQKQILSLLPSETLKKEITNKSWHFSDRDLLAIAWHYAPDFDARIDLLRLLEQQTEGDLKAYIRRILETQIQMLAEMVGTSAPYISRLINKKDGIVNKVFVEMLEKLGYDIQVTYVKKEQ